MKVNIERWMPGKANKRVEAFLNRPRFSDRAERTAQRVLTDIRKRGDSAVAEWTQRFDGVKLRPQEFRIPAKELSLAERHVPAAVRTAIGLAHRRIAAFARRGMKPNWTMPSGGGGFLGERFVPLDRVGVYVPGGKAPLISTALMTVTLARVAGVSEIVACTPCGPDKRVAPALLYALRVAGATEVYRVGGIQAVGVMAYGTATVRKVQKIVGPGGPFVTAAKRLVYGVVALDLVAGPSEIAILADESAEPRCVAADLLSQAEHGTGLEKALLVTTSERLARATAAEVLRQACDVNSPALRAVLKQGLLLVVVPSIECGIELCNRFAPEHLELQIRQPQRYLVEVRCAGAVFVGPWTPEAVGDYVAGPSHVLPTGGSAANFSGLSVEDFRRRISIMAFHARDLRQTCGAIATLARAEGLEAHARSAETRFAKK